MLGIIQHIIAMITLLSKLYCTYEARLYNSTGNNICVAFVHHSYLSPNK